MLGNAGANYFYFVRALKSDAWVDSDRVGAFNFTLVSPLPTNMPTNIALGADPLESDPGWGGGSYPLDIVDGRTFYTDTGAG